jgi:hypothetical protein
VTAGRGFDPGELGTARADEIEDALIAASRLRAATDDTSVRPSAGFAERVMTAIADEPAPSAVGFLAPLSRGGFRVGFGASVRQAWATAFGGGRPVFARATALAYVLAVAIAATSLAGVATVGIAGALNQLGPTPTQSKAPETPGPSIAPDATTEPSEASEPPEPAGSPEPSESPESAGESEHPGDDGSGSGSSGSGGSGSGSHETARPTSSGGGDDGSEPESSGSGSDKSDSESGSSTPKPSETPH